MTDLKCSVENCVYNKSECCCKGDILVGGKHAENKDDTCCESFAQEGKDHVTSALEHPSKMISIAATMQIIIYYVTIYILLFLPIKLLNMSKII